MFSLKGAYKNSPFIVQLLMVFFLSFCLGSLAFALLFDLFLLIKGISLSGLSENLPNLMSNGEVVRVMMFLQTICLFFFPALILAYLFSEDKNTYLHINTRIKTNVVFLIIISIVVVSPFLNLVMQVNELMKLPESLKIVENWMMDKEEEAKQLTEVMLHSKSVFILIFNILVVGLLVALGEEFIFRGVMQNVFRKVLKNEHLIIWTVAIIFSAMHLQFYGFIPRMFLGAYLGYLLYYTKSIWAPVLAHLTNNILGVVTYYSFQDTDRIEQIDQIGTGQGWWIALVSLLLWAAIFIQIKRTSAKA